MAEAPTPAPAKNTAEILAEISAIPDPEKRKEAIAKDVRDRTMEELEELANAIKSNDVLKADEARLNEFKEEMKKQVEVLRQAAAIEQALAMLEGKVALLELLPELKPEEKTRYAKGWDKAAGIAIDTGKAILGFFKDTGGLIGGVTTSIYNYLSNPENYTKIANTIGNSATRLWYTVLKTPTLIGIPPNFPGLGKLAANATEKLAQMDAVDAIYEIVNAEKGAGAKPLVTFDGKFDKGVWLRWKPEERTPEAIQQMALSFIDAQKKAGQGTMAQPIVVTMATLRNPEEAAKVAAEALQTELATALGVEKIDFGSPASAKKGTDGKWSLTIAAGDVDQRAKKIVGGSTAEKLAPSIKSMPTVDEVVIEPGKEEIEVRKEGGKTKVTASIEKISSEAAHIETLANTVQGGRVTVLKIGDPSLRTDVPRAVFSQTNRMLATNEKSMQLGAAQIAKILSEKIPSATDRQEWKWDGSAWIEEPLPTA